MRIVGTEPVADSHTSVGGGTNTTLHSVAVHPAQVDIAQMRGLLVCFWEVIPQLNSEKLAVGYMSYLSMRCHQPLFNLAQGFAMRRARPLAAAKSH